MERITTHSVVTNDLNALPYEKSVAELSAEAQEMEELSCSLLLKNLLKNNLRLVKLNEMSAIFFF